MAGGARYGLVLESMFLQAGRAGRETAGVARQWHGDGGNQFGSFRMDSKLSGAGNLGPLDGLCRKALNSHFSDRIYIMRFHCQPPETKSDFKVRTCSSLGLKLGDNAQTLKFSQVGPR